MGDPYKVWHKMKKERAMTEQQRVTQALLLDAEIASNHRYGLVPSHPRNFGDPVLGYIKCNCKMRCNRSAKPPKQVRRRKEEVEDA